jgi:hypothetical protein
VHLALADSQPADAATEAEETEDRMTDLLTMSFVVSLCALAVILHAWDGIQGSIVAWWRRRQMRIAAKKAARFRLPWRVRLDYLATIEQKKPITPKAAR